MTTQRDNVQWQLDAQQKPKIARPCPVCPTSSGVINGEKCPACQRSGKVLVASGERVALTFLERSSKGDPKLSENNRRRYHVEIACKAQIPANATAEVFEAIRRPTSIYVWAYSSEKAMVAARDAAIWDGIPRPFEITVSRSFLVEDEVIQRTRSTCAEDKELSE